jgi:hypothetical protein
MIFIAREPANLAANRQASSAVIDVKSAIVGSLPVDRAPAGMAEDGAAVDGLRSADLALAPALSRGA